MDGALKGSRNLGKRELWRTWPTNPRYLVSNKGRCLGFVRGCKSRVTLSPTVSKIGYAEYKLLVNVRTKTVSAHRIVAETFIPNPHHLSDVHHIDEDKTNNDVDNLMWVSHKENCNLGTGKIRSGEKHRARWARLKAWEKEYGQYKITGDE